MLTFSDETTPSSPDKLFGREGACPLLNEILAPELYRRSPFRLLGLPVLAGARETTRRIDQLRLSAELGDVTPEWSFAPPQLPEDDRIRAAAQTLKDPAVRLVYELFWFWPENYPDETSADPALELLAHGDTAAVVHLWEVGSAHGRIAAIHNLAVYHHLQALDMEQQENPSEDELIKLWFKALRSWDKAGMEEELWSRLAGRVARLGDARLTTSFVDDIRVTLPDALAKLCAALAVEHGGRGRHDRAALHAALVTHIHGDTAGARRALESYSAPIARRIDTRLTAAKNRFVRTGGVNLADVVMLLRECREDLHIIELLCGRTADYHIEVSHAVLDVVLDFVVAHQRDTRDDRGCLPILVHLCDFEAMPELKARTMETMYAVYGNVLNASASDDRLVLNGSGEVVPAVDPEQGRALVLISEVIVPGWRTLWLNGPARSHYATRAAGMLKDLAVRACMERDDLDLAVQAFATALQLPVSLELRESLESDRAQLQMDFETRREKELRAEDQGHVLIVNRNGICLDEVWVTPEEFAGLKYGAVLSGGEVVGHTIGWRSAAGNEFEINASNMLPASPEVPELYNRVVDSIYFFLVPGLVDRLVAGVRAGEAPQFGDAVLHPEGILLPDTGGFWQRGNEVVPYGRVETVVERGRVIVSSKDNPRLTETFDVASTWNAAVLRYVVEAMTRE